MLRFRENGTASCRQASTDIHAETAFTAIRAYCNPKNLPTDLQRSDTFLVREYLPFLQP